ncbi:hypothetical protein [Micromonospora carbonacea]|uniref:Uncharacterized protein n=1 Tax=Micromonospora carbonacea TaxID=47853 RepID=A0A1C5A9L6_9ACTN|nr:hypothetical protein [Micromonospora carbonacea]SCF41942.1 hypothetical protein GA0070563_11218 [Micromonospora carbonacea]
MPATIAHTREPLPDGANTRMRVGRCRTCNRTSIEGSSRHGIITPRTRSVEPDADGRYEMQPHELWCPVWTGETPEVACPHPHCGAPVVGLTYRPGYQVRVPWTSPFGNPGTLVGTLDEIDASEAVGGETTADPRFDKADLVPCGHTVEGSQAQQVRDLFEQVRDARHRREAEAEIARHAVVLAAADAAGHAVLVEQYRQAVLNGSTDKAGLLAALRTLAGRPQK